MARELMILRHGKSDWDVDASDFHRPLTDRGKRGAQRMGVWLWQQGLQPDHIVSSPAERALVTAEKLSKAMGRGSSGIQRDERIYEAWPGDLMTVLRDCPEAAQRVLLVGHNPGLEMLLTQLAGDSLEAPADGKTLPTATLARLEMPDDWESLYTGCARVISVTRPGDLPGKFPYPAPDGDDLRDRPAYYYTQSSVIPYRLRDGEPEILVISSSKKKHFVVPKGIKDPGLTPQQSAAKEAREEAGVEGKVGADPIGSYAYEKWGATCTVDVYPMMVTEVVPEDEWEERHRGRQWVSPEEAAKRLKQIELAPIVETLARRLRGSA
ncbi:MAG: histidine phosphatase family protein [Pseudomonadota bacterium]|nr:histidine phosphatase family protein [Pseudomonadota bacterium]